MTSHRLTHSLIHSNLDTKIEDNSRAFKLQKANFDSEVNTAVWNTWFWKWILNESLQKAEAQLAYELQAAKIQQRIKQEELQIQVRCEGIVCFSLWRGFWIIEFGWKENFNVGFFFQVVERRKQIEIEEQEIKRKEKELMATVKLPAEAESFKVQTVAEGMRWNTNLRAETF